tara:strand:+ start:9421 stop:10182 length:762 start_codon:yes stop_codon:yes gene_type:complete
MKKIVIYQEWGGLGDNLAHTTIPKLCEKYGYECFLSKQNNFRNKDIKDLLFKDIPTIDEVNTSWVDNYTVTQSKEWNHIRSIQLGYGFKEAPYSYPFINYEPKFIKELKDITLMDLSGLYYFKYFSHIFTEQNLTRLYNKILSLNNNFGKVKTVQKPNISCNEVIISEEKYSINNLFDYCDAIYSCKNFITVDSGQSNLASCIKNQFLENKKLNIYTIGLQKNLPPNNYNSYFYLNTNHIALDTGRMYKALDY